MAMGTAVDSGTGSDSATPAKGAWDAEGVDPKRSRIMAAIRCRDTGCELVLRRALWRHGLRGYRTRAKVAGHPDVAYVSRRVAVFVDGCFWHRCPMCYRPARHRAEFWDSKIARNVARDREVTHAWQDAGWIVLRFWEHEVRANVEHCVMAVAAALGPQSGG